jgi:hypothetical protein
MTVCLSCRYDSDGVSFGFRENNNGQNITQPANADPSILSVFFPVIQERHHGIIKKGRRILEGDTVLLYVMTVLISSQVKFIVRSVYTFSIYVKPFFCVSRNIYLRNP